MHALLGVNFIIRKSCLCTKISNIKFALGVNINPQTPLSLSLICPVPVGSTCSSDVGGGCQLVKYEPVKKQMCTSSQRF